VWSLLMTLTNWLLFMSILEMISFWLAGTQKMLLYMTSLVENVYNYLLICIENPLMSWNLHTIPPSCLPLPHLTMMSSCGIWDRNHSGHAIQHQAQVEMWWFAFHQMIAICLYQLLIMRYSLLDYVYTQVILEKLLANSKFLIHECVWFLNMKHTD